MNENKIDIMVDHPAHYNSETGLEAIDVIEAFTFDLKGIDAVCTANVLKYMCRWPKKDGLRDLKNARCYLDRLIKHVELIEKENEPADPTKEAFRTAANNAKVLKNFDIAKADGCANKIKKEIQSESASVTAFNDILFGTVAAAENVINGLNNIICEYGVATMADLYDIAGVNAPSYISNSLGWATVVPKRVDKYGCSDKYIIVLPKPYPIVNGEEVKIKKEND